MSCPFFGIESKPRAPCQIERGSQRLENNIVYRDKILNSIRGADSECMTGKESSTC